MGIDMLWVAVFTVGAVGDNEIRINFLHLFADGRSKIRQRHINAPGNAVDFHIGVYEGKKKDILCSQGPGRWMRFARRYRGTDYLYLLGLVVDGGTIYALEAGGEKDVFEKDLPRVIEAFGTLN